MRIYLVPDGNTFKSLLFRARPKTSELERMEIDKQLKAGVIKSAMSKWAAPMMFALTMMENFASVSSTGKSIRWPSRIHILYDVWMIIDTLGDAQYFTTLGAYSGYSQMNIRKQDRQKTALVCHYGTFQCIRMPFGLTNAPVCFQRAPDLSLTKYKWNTCLEYLDDVTILSNHMDDQIKHVDEILITLMSNLWQTKHK